MWTNSTRTNSSAITPEVWDELKELVTNQLSNKRLFVVDGYCGANPDTRLSIRVITEVAWQAHFVKNMFIRPTEEELATFEPDFVVMNGAKCTNPKWEEQGLNSENFTVFNLTERMQLIGGTWYGGEMKKGMFAMMNYFLPLKIGQSHTAWGCCGVSQLKSALLLAHLNFSGFVSLKLLAQRLHHHEEHWRQ